jgi:hypothetical protein
MQRADDSAMAGLGYSRRMNLQVKKFTQTLYRRPHPGVTFYWTVGMMLAA